MDRIKSVGKADTVQCRDAVTKEALKAVLSRSRNVSYREIDIHTVKTADVLNAHIEDTICVCRSSSKVSAQKAEVCCASTDVPGYRNAGYNLTIEELFSGTGRNFR